MLSSGKSRLQPCCFDPPALSSVADNAKESNGILPSDHPMSRDHPDLKPVFIRGKVFGLNPRSSA
jgi:hypothetical protein